jgi:hypothetical protein
MDSSRGSTNAVEKKCSFYVRALTKRWKCVGIPHDSTLGTVREVPRQPCGRAILHLLVMVVLKGQPILLRAQPCLYSDR